MPNDLHTLCVCAVRAMCAVIERTLTDTKLHARRTQTHHPIINEPNQQPVSLAPLSPACETPAPLFLDSLVLAYLDVVCSIGVFVGRATSKFKPKPSPTHGIRYAATWCSGCCRPCRQAKSPASRSNSAHALLRLCQLSVPIPPSKSSQTKQLRSLLVQCLFPAKPPALAAALLPPHPSTDRHKAQPGVMSCEALAVSGQEAKPRHRAQPVAYHYETMAVSDLLDPSESFFQ